MPASRHTLSSSSSSCPKPYDSISHLHHRLLEMERNAIQERRKLISAGKRELNRSWRNLCHLLKGETGSCDPVEEDQQFILDSCLQVIVKERISLEKENLEIQRLRHLYEKSKAQASPNDPIPKIGTRKCARQWKGKHKPKKINRGPL